MATAGVAHELRDALSKAKADFGELAATLSLCDVTKAKKGDIVWTSPNSFVASANCALYCGAKVDFVDIDSRTYNISIEALSNKLKIAKEIL